MYLLKEKMSYYTHEILCNCSGTEHMFNQIRSEPKCANTQCQTCNPPQSIKQSSPVPIVRSSRFKEDSYNKKTLELKH